MKLLSLEHQGRKDKDTKDLLEQSWMKRDLSHVRENVAAGSHTAAQKLGQALADSDKFKGTRDELLGRIRGDCGGGWLGQCRGSASCCGTSCLRIACVSMRTFGKSPRNLPC